MSSPTSCSSFVLTAPCRSRRVRWPIGEQSACAPHADRIRLSYDHLISCANCGRMIENGSCVYEGRSRQKMFTARHGDSRNHRGEQIDEYRELVQHTQVAAVVDMLRRDNPRASAVTCSVTMPAPYRDHSKPSA